MIPYTYPSTVKNNIAHCLVYPLSSVSGLKAWVDYIPVKKATGATEGCFEGTGSQPVTELTSVTGLQSWLHYIPVYYNNALTKPFSTDAAGYIPVSPDAYVYGMDGAGDFVSTPDSVNTSLTGDLTLIVEAALTDWTPFTSNVFVAKDNATNKRSYAFTVLSSGVLRFLYSLDGTTSLGSNSTVVVPFTNGKKYHVAVERESATGKIRFYTSLDGEVFTQLGAELTGTAGALYDGDTPVEFGNLAALSYPLVGSVYKSEGYSGLAITKTNSPTLKFDFNPDDWVSGTTFTSKSTGEVWTLNGSAAIYK